MLRSLWDIAPQLASGQLVRVLEQYAMHDADIHWLAPYRSQLPTRIRLLQDFLASRFRQEPWKTQRLEAGRTTQLTPTAVTAMPASVTKVMGSLNKIQAITAVVGGTRYMRLVTEAAAPR